MPTATRPVSTKVKVCKRLVHNGTERVKCENIYQSIDCPRIHVMKIKTGFCNLGQCEGTKPRGNKDKPLPTCKTWQECACECHVALDKMFKDVGMDRVLVENPEYLPEKVDFNIEDYLNIGSSDVRFSDTGVNGPDGIEVITTAPRLPELAERRTETGRAARGGLEAQVLLVCSEYVENKMIDMLIPKNIANVIAGKYKIPAPSTGAIGAVFNRWESIGFAKQDRKPVRFSGFTGSGTPEELERIKAKSKREKKMMKSASQRGFRS